MHELAVDLGKEDLKQATKLSGGYAEANPRLVGTLLEDILHDWQRGKGIRPTGVESQMRDNLRGLRLGQTVVHCPIEVVWKLRNLSGGNQGADRDQTPIAWCKIRTQPQVAEQNVSGVLHDARSDVAVLLFCLCGS